ncbi:hypothetical protein G6011_00284, partial [Alternaria panax]
MNTWLVGHLPMGHHQIDYTKITKLLSGLTEYGAKRLLIKARIL